MAGSTLRVMLKVFFGRPLSATSSSVKGSALEKTAVPMAGQRILPLKRRMPPSARESGIAAIAASSQPADLPIRSHGPDIIWLLCR